MWSRGQFLHPVRQASNVRLLHQVSQLLRCHGGLNIQVPKRRREGREHRLNVLLQRGGAIRLESGVVRCAQSLAAPRLRLGLLIVCSLRAHVETRMTCSLNAPGRIAVRLLLVKETAGALSENVSRTFVPSRCGAAPPKRYATCCCRQVPLHMAKSSRPAKTKNKSTVRNSRATVSGPAEPGASASGDIVAEKAAGTQDVASAFPFNPNKAAEYDPDAALAPPEGASVKPADPIVGASTGQ